MAGGTSGVEDDSAVVAAADVLLKTQVTVYHAGHGLHLSALTASNNGSLFGDLGESYTALVFSWVKTEEFLVL